ncbi:MAG: hypothetical protein J2P54_01385 [Bradyrhizobiaceae bacterium]|jgi:hypothetical protein|nr:hypothetical protein [Bradyrhizobiaceae bacterium]
MNKRFMSVLVVGAVLGLAIGFAIHKFSGGGLFLDWVRGRTWQDAAAWLGGGAAISWALTVLRGRA